MEDHYMNNHPYTVIFTAGHKQMLFLDQIDDKKHIIIATSKAKEQYFVDLGCMQH